MSKPYESEHVFHLYSIEFANLYPSKTTLFLDCYMLPYRLDYIFTHISGEWHFGSLDPTSLSRIVVERYLVDIIYSEIVFYGEISTDHIRVR